MRLKNLAKRLITINADSTNEYDGTGKVVLRVVPGKAYDLLPAGEAVEVPKKFRKHPYVVALLKCGDICVLEEPEAEVPVLPVAPEPEAEVPVLPAPKVPKVPKVTRRA